MFPHFLSYKLVAKLEGVLFPGLEVLPLNKPGSELEMSLFHLTV